MSEVNWTATGGTIASNGVFTAGPDEGNFLVTLASEERSATATVVVAKDPKQQPIPTPMEVPKKLTWTGMVPSQKWSQLYMKVLTKLVSTGDLNLTVSIEVTPKGGVTDQQVEETKANLRGLGLSDDITTE